MGLSASQARLLTLTSRLHDIEYKQQQLSNVKMRLAADSEEISNAYATALNKQKFQFKTAPNQYDTMTVNNLYGVGSNYILKNAKGQTCLPQSLYNMYKAVVDTSIDSSSWANRNVQRNLKPNENYDLFNAFMEAKVGCSTAEFANKVFAAAGRNLDWNKDYNQIGTEFGIGGGKGTWQGLVKYAQQQGITSVPGATIPTLEDVDYYEKMFQQFTTGADTEKKTSNNGGSHTYTAISASNMNDFMVIQDDLLNNANWLYEAIESGEYTLCDMSGKQVNISGNSNITSVSDKTDVAKAEAEYNAATAKINRKEKQIDNQMKTLDTEHSAITQDYESTKKIISDHAQKDFNMFG